MWTENTKSGIANVAMFPNVLGMRGSVSTKSCVRKRQIKLGVIP